MNTSWHGFRPNDDAPAKTSGVPEEPPSEVLLFPDYTGPGWEPLWPSSDATDTYFTKDLLQRLVAWHDDFQANYQFEEGWVSEDARERWAAEATVLEADVRRQVAGKASLVVDLWPLGQAKRRYTKSGQPGWGD